MSGDNKSWHRYRDAVSASTKLAQQNKHNEALQLLDGAIATAVGERESRWVLTLNHHAAVITRFLKDWPRARHYYEQSLAFNPDNPAALSGLADVAKEQGDLRLAKEYAARCYKVLAEGDHFLRDERLETLLKKWPELGQ